MRGIFLISSLYRLKENAVWSRFVDRDMFMRYYFGFGVGHVYSWTEKVEEWEGEASEGAEEQDEAKSVALGDHDDTDSLNSMDCGPDDESEVDVARDDLEDESDDDEFLARVEMHDSD